MPGRTEVGEADGEWSDGSEDAVKSGSATDASKGDNEDGTGWRQSGKMPSSLSTSGNVLTMSSKTLGKKDPVHSVLDKIDAELAAMGCASPTPTQNTKTSWSKNSTTYRPKTSLPPLLTGFGSLNTDTSGKPGSGKGLAIGGASLADPKNISGSAEIYTDATLTDDDVRATNQATDDFLSDLDSVVAQQIDSRFKEIMLQKRVTPSPQPLQSKPTFLTTSPFPSAHVDTPSIVLNSPKQQQQQQPPSRPLTLGGYGTDNDSIKTEDFESRFQNLIVLTDADTNNESPMKTKPKPKRNKNGCPNGALASTSKKGGPGNGPAIRSNSNNVASKSSTTEKGNSSSSGVGSGGGRGAVSSPRVSFDVTPKEKEDDEKTDSSGLGNVRLNGITRVLQHSMKSLGETTEEETTKQPTTGLASLPPTGRSRSVSPDKLSAAPQHPPWERAGLHGGGYPGYRSGQHHHPFQHPAVALWRQEARNNDHDKPWGPGGNTSSSDSKPSTFEEVESLCFSKSSSGDSFGPFHRRQRNGPSALPPTPRTATGRGQGRIPSGRFLSRQSSTTSTSTSSGLLQDHLDKKCACATSAASGGSLCEENMETLDPRQQFDLNDHSPMDGIFKRVLEWNNAHAALGLGREGTGEGGSNNTSLSESGPFPPVPPPGFFRPRSSTQPPGGYHNPPHPHPYAHHHLHHHPQPIYPHPYFQGILDNANSYTGPNRRVPDISKDKGMMSASPEMARSQKRRDLILPDEEEEGGEGDAIGLRSFGRRFDNGSSRTNKTPSGSSAATSPLSSKLTSFDSHASSLSAMAFHQENPLSAVSYHHGSPGRDQFYSGYREAQSTMLHPAQGQVNPGWEEPSQHPPWALGHWGQQREGWRKQQPSLSPRAPFIPPPLAGMMISGSSYFNTPKLDRGVSVESMNSFGLASPPETFAPTSYRAPTLRQNTAEMVLMNLGFGGSAEGFLPDRFLRDWYTKLARAQGQNMANQAHSAENAAASLPYDVSNTAYPRDFSGYNPQDSKIGMPPKPNYEDLRSASDLHRRLNDSQLRAAAILESHDMPDSPIAALPAHLGHDSRTDRLKEYVEAYNYNLSTAVDYRARRIEQWASSRQKSLPLFLETLTEEDEAMSRGANYKSQNRESRVHAFLREHSFSENSESQNTSSCGASNTTSQLGSESDSLSGSDYRELTLNKRRKLFSEPCSSPLDRHPVSFESKHSQGYPKSHEVSEKLGTPIKGRSPEHITHSSSDSPQNSSRLYSGTPESRKGLISDGLQRSGSPGKEKKKKSPTAKEKSSSHRSKSPRRHRDISSNKELKHKAAVSKKTLRTNPIVTSPEDSPQNSKAGRNGHQASVGNEDTVFQDKRRSQMKKECLLPSVIPSSDGMPEMAPRQLYNNMEIEKPTNDSNHESAKTEHLLSTESIEVADILQNQKPCVVGGVEFSGKHNIKRQNVAEEGTKQGQIEPAMISIVLEDVDGNMTRNSVHLDTDDNSSENYQPCLPQSEESSSQQGDHLNIALPSSSSFSSLSLSPIPQSPVTVIEVSLDNQQDSIDTEEGAGSCRELYDKDDVFSIESDVIQTNFDVVRDDTDQKELPTKAEMGVYRNIPWAPPLSEHRKNGGETWTSLMINTFEVSSESADGNVSPMLMSSDVLHSSPLSSTSSSSLSVAASSSKYSDVGMQFDQSRLSPLVLLKESTLSALVQNDESGELYLVSDQSVQCEVENNLSGDPDVVQSDVSMNPSHDEHSPPVLEVMHKVTQTSRLVRYEMSSQTDESLTTGNVNLTQVVRDESSGYRPRETSFQPVSVTSGYSTSHKKSFQPTSGNSIGDSICINPAQESHCYSLSSHQLQSSLWWPRSSPFSSPSSTSPAQLTRTQSFDFEFWERLGIESPQSYQRNLSSPQRALFTAAADKAGVCPLQQRDMHTSSVVSCCHSSGFRHSPVRENGEFLLCPDDTRSPSDTQQERAQIHKRTNIKSSPIFLPKRSPAKLSKIRLVNSLSDNRFTSNSLIPDRSFRSLAQLDPQILASASECRQSEAIKTRATTPKTKLGDVCDKMCVDKESFCPLTRPVTMGMEGRGGDSDGEHKEEDRGSSHHVSILSVNVNDYRLSTFGSPPGPDSVDCVRNEGKYASPYIDILPRLPRKTNSIKVYPSPNLLKCTEKESVSLSVLLPEGSTQQNTHCLDIRGHAERQPATTGVYNGSEDICYQNNDSKVNRVTATSLQLGLQTVRKNDLVSGNSTTTGLFSGTGNKLSVEQFNCQEKARNFVLNSLLLRGSADLKSKESDSSVPTITTDKYSGIQDDKLQLSVQRLDQPLILGAEECGCDDNKLTCPDVKLYTIKDYENKKLLSYDVKPGCDGVRLESTDEKPRYHYAKHGFDNSKRNSDDEDYTFDDVKCVSYNVKFKSDDVKCVSDDIKYEPDDVTCVPDDVKPSLNDIKHAPDDAKYHINVVHTSMHDVKSSSYLIEPDKLEFNGVQLEHSDVKPMLSDESPEHDDASYGYDDARKKALKMFKLHKCNIDHSIDETKSVTIQNKSKQDVDQNKIVSADDYSDNQQAQCPIRTINNSKDAPNNNTHIAVEYTSPTTTDYEHKTYNGNPTIEDLDVEPTAELFPNKIVLKRDSNEVRQDTAQKMLGRKSWLMETFVQSLMEYESACRHMQMNRLDNEQGITDFDHSGYGMKDALMTENSHGNKHLEDPKSQLKKSPATSSKIKSDAIMYTDTILVDNRSEADACILSENQTPGFLKLTSSSFSQSSETEIPDKKNEKLLSPSISESKDGKLSWCDVDESKNYFKKTCTDYLEAVDADEQLDVPPGSSSPSSCLHRQYNTPIQQPIPVLIASDDACQQSDHLHNKFPQMPTSHCKLQVNHARGLFEKKLSADSQSSLQVNLSESIENTSELSELEIQTCDGLTGSVDDVLQLSEFDLVYVKENMTNLGSKDASNLSIQGLKTRRSSDLPRGENVSCCEKAKHSTHSLFKVYTEDEFCENVCHGESLSNPLLSEELSLSRELFHYPSYNQTLCKTEVNNDTDAETSVKKSLDNGLHKPLKISSDNAFDKSIMEKPLDNTGIEDSRRKASLKLGSDILQYANSGRRIDDSLTDFAEENGDYEMPDVSSFVESVDDTGATNADMNKHQASVSTDHNSFNSSLEMAAEEKGFGMEILLQPLPLEDKLGKMLACSPSNLNSSADPLHVAEEVVPSYELNTIHSERHRPIINVAEENFSEGGKQDFHVRHSHAVVEEQIHEDSVLPLNLPPIWANVLENTYENPRFLRAGNQELKSPILFRNPVKLFSKMETAPFSSSDWLADNDHGGGDDDNKDHGDNDEDVDHDDDGDNYDHTDNDDHGDEDSVAKNSVKIFIDNSTTDSDCGGSRKDGYIYISGPKELAHSTTEDNEMPTKFQSKDFIDSSSAGVTAMSVSEEPEDCVSPICNNSAAQIENIIHSKNAPLHMVHIQNSDRTTTREQRRPSSATARRDAYNRLIAGEGAVRFSTSFSEEILSSSSSPLSLKCGSFHYVSPTEGEVDHGDCSADKVTKTTLDTSPRFDTDERLSVTNELQLPLNEQCLVSPRSSSCSSMIVVKTSNLQSKHTSINIPGRPKSPLNCSNSSLVSLSVEDETELSSCLLGKSEKSIVCSNVVPNAHCEEDAEAFSSAVNDSRLETSSSEKELTFEDEPLQFSLSRAFYCKRKAPLTRRYVPLWSEEEHKSWPCGSPEARQQFSPIDGLSSFDSDTLHSFADVNRPAMNELTESQISEEEESKLGFKVNCTLSSSPDMPESRRGSSPSACMQSEVCEVEDKCQTNQPSKTGYESADLISNNPQSLSPLNSSLRTTIFSSKSPYTKSSPSELSLRRLRFQNPGNACPVQRNCSSSEGSSSENGAVPRRKCYWSTEMRTVVSPFNDNYTATSYSSGSDGDRDGGAASPKSDRGLNPKEPALETLTPKTQEIRD